MTSKIKHRKKVTKQIKKIEIRDFQRQTSISRMPCYIPLHPTTYNKLLSMVSIIVSDIAQIIPHRKYKVVAESNTESNEVGIEPI